MDLWRGSLSEFVRTAESGELPGRLAGQYVNIYKRNPSPGETISWINSLPHLAAALRDLGGADLGISIDAGHYLPAGALRAADGAGPSAANIGVSAEYHLPLSGQRVDVLLCGRGADDRERAVALELKQWSRAELENDFARNVRVDGVEHVHPCEQARDYARWLADYHEAFTAEGVDASPCAFLHNMRRQDAAPLLDDRFGDLLKESPLFLAQESHALADRVSRQVGAGGGMAVLDRLSGSRFRPSKNVLANLEAVIRARREWRLIGEQRIAYNAILSEMRRLQGRRGRSAILVRGGPGTGKSVIAVQLLADALRLGLKAAHVTGGKAFTTTLRGQFAGADKLFQWNMNMRTAPFQGLDLLLVDEAHRIRETSDTRFTRTAERNRNPAYERTSTLSRHGHPAHPGE